ncbi:uncharacterized protein Z519_03867 [Cladophialophora bantiana CBS 173.52]|uniref:Xylanolytic transcriptional activator regulatory domain-containing protein n=1 Tax=Cladophialophora bantiana (strain ATCC 10958 / CBS 173.52 / CDC B-1940 / NIH 8579) TaxID=1442370 RepID=A0A0D2HPF7_CLAB1|nr:uncharacterized protein Z519_03867 [Cladophialophora bantiana CBS 173.52]KIW95283.1 hypothetical protein Z519_03867 [Cladophialophora bantiana CBS 173.52]
MPDDDFSHQDTDADIREEIPDQNCFVLPPRALAHRLVDLFFDNVAPILPLVHEPSFRKELDALYDDHKSASIAFSSVINVVFAYGCDYLDLDLKRTYELAQTFHERATDLILLVCYELASLEVVQALLLVTLHLNSSMQFHRMWINTGLLVRTAQALNLHLDPSDWDISMMEKELRKRFWWSIYSLDRFISLKHGRPPALNIEAGHCVQPAAVDDDQILPAYIAKSQDPRRQPSQLHFFNSLMQLIHISETALSSSSANVSSKRIANGGLAKEVTKEVIYTQISGALEQESKLATWVSGLPEHLRFDYSNSNPKLRKQQRSLQTRYLHTRLMIHRPNMISVLRLDKGLESLEGNDGFLQAVLTASIQQCVQCSCDLIRLVEEYYEQKSLGPWWLLLQFIFTTLATLFAVRARKNLLRCLDDNAINIAIEKAMTLLRSFGDINPTLTQCRQYFELMMPLTIAQGFILDTENVYSRLRIPTDSQAQALPFSNPAFTGQMTPQQRPVHRAQSSMDYLPGRDAGLRGADQAMAGYTAEIFSDATFGSFSFETLDPILQM